MQERSSLQRRGRRIAVRLPVRVTTAGEAFDAAIVNVGEGGLGLSMAKAHAPGHGQRLSLVVRLPRQTALLTFELEVAWAVAGVRDVEVGARFLERGGPAQDALARFLDGYRARVVVVGRPLSPELATALEEQAELEEVGGESLGAALADGLTSLVLVSSDEALEAALAEPLARELPVVALIEGSTERAEALARRSPRLVLHRIPTAPALLSAVVARTLRAHALALENEHLALELEFRDAEVRAPPSEPALRPAGVIGASDAMQRVYDQLERVARVDSSVVLLGETGTGKGLFARVLHERSHRSRRPMVTQNCAALTESLLDAELFGHVRGAFTGAVADRPGLLEAANGGTVLLDEVAEMSLGMQARLLHVLQEGELRRVGSTTPVRVDVRVICATHADLEQLVRERRFREDLYYRLVSFVVRLPALRERVPDIVPLARHFLVQFSARNRLPLPRLTRAAEAELERAPWPGNVRQLQHTLERLCLLAPASLEIDAPLVREALGPTATAAGGVLERELEGRERAMVQRALDDAGGVIAEAARALGLQRSTLSRRLAKLGISARPRSG